MFQAHLIFSLFQPLSQVFLQGTLFLFSSFFGHLHLNIFLQSVAHSLSQNLSEKFLISMKFKWSIFLSSIVLFVFLLWWAGVSFNIWLKKIGLKWPAQGQPVQTPPPFPHPECSSSATQEAAGVLCVHMRVCVSAQTRIHLNKYINLYLKQPKEQTRSKLIDG